MLGSAAYFVPSAVVGRAVITPVSITSQAAPSYTGHLVPGLVPGLVLLLAASRNYSEQSDHQRVFNINTYKLIFCLLTFSSNCSSCPIDFSLILISGKYFVLMQ